MCPSLIQIGSKTAEKNSAQTNKQTDTTKIMVTWPWTNYYISIALGSLYTAKWEGLIHLGQLSQRTRPKLFSWCQLWANFSHSFLIVVMNDYAYHHNLILIIPGCTIKFRSAFQPRLAISALAFAGLLLLIKSASHMQILNVVDILLGSNASASAPDKIHSVDERKQWLNE